MTTEEQLKHRLAMVLDDLKVIRKFIAQEGMSRTFQMPSSTSNEAFSNLNNIEIACDLTNDECLTWKYYNYNEVDEIINKLKDLDIDGQQMQYILEKVGMSDQMHRQLVMSRPIQDSEILLQEKKGL
jgi:ABC-type branched-subunit amino acid transport system ATPase component